MKMTWAEHRTASNSSVVLSSYQLSSVESNGTLCTGREIKRANLYPQGTTSEKGMDIVRVSSKRRIKSSRYCEENCKANMHSQARVKCNKFWHPCLCVVYSYTPTEDEYRRIRCYPQTPFCTFMRFIFPSASDIVFICRVPISMCLFSSPQNAYVRQL